jgi:hypothetical protein
MYRPAEMATVMYKRVGCRADNGSCQRDILRKKNEDTYTFLRGPNWRALVRLPLVVGTSFSASDMVVGVLGCSVESRFKYDAKWHRSAQRFIPESMAGSGWLAVCAYITAGQPL